jgi:hypothetical protein
MAGRRIVHDSWWKSVCEKTAKVFNTYSTRYNHGSPMNHRYHLRVKAELHTQLRREDLLIQRSLLKQEV